MNRWEARRINEKIRATERALGGATPYSCPKCGHTLFRPCETVPPTRWLDCRNKDCDARPFWEERDEAAIRG